MRQVILAAMVSASCLSSVPVRSQESAPLKKALARGYKLKEQKRDVEAVAAFSAVLAKDPENIAALTELGYLNENLHHRATAVKYLAAASARDPQNMRLRMDLGYAEQSVKRYSAAAAEFRLVAAQPGEFQSQARQAQDTVAAAEQAGSPAEAARRRLLAQGYAALKKGDKPAARRAFEAASAADAKDPVSRKELGYLDLAQGRTESAAANFEAARALAPDDYFVALQLGYTYDKLRKRDQARAAFGAALASTDAKIHDAAQAALQSSGGPGAPVSPSSL